MERLEEVLDGSGTPDAVLGEHAWIIEDAGQADWAGRKLAKANRAIAEVEQLAKQQIDAINAWKHDEMVRLEKERENWLAKLADYHRARLAEDDHVKTIRLPHVTLTARKKQDGVDIPDPLGVLEVLKKDFPFYVRTKVIEEIDRKAVKEAVLKSGEIIPGVYVAPGEVEFSASTDVEEVTE
jgi:phage host-nuclease inhibitor protein Gam